MPFHPITASTNSTLTIGPFLLIGASLFLTSSVAFLPPFTSVRPANNNDCEQDVFRQSISWAATISKTRSALFKTSESCLVSLSATGSDKKRKRRRRKDQSPETSLPDPVKSSQEKLERVDELEPTFEEDDDDEELSEEDIYQIQNVAKFEFEKDSATSMSVRDVKGAPGSAEAIPLPDIKEMLKKKEEEERARIEEQKLKEKSRIKRSDKEAFTRLLEQQPYADADDSFFVEEEYTTVSALLGERAKPFLGIPTGPLQVGHFIGALGIVLMAFIQYPGFPLTNLPTPLREFLQGGLAVTYAINLVLAVLAVFKASERGQPALLWVAKTFSVGGLAYDQLTQLPMSEEVNKSKTTKSKRK